MTDDDQTDPDSSEDSEMTDENQDESNLVNDTPMTSEEQGDSQIVDDTPMTGENQDDSKPVENIETTAEGQTATLQSSHERLGEESRSSHPSNNTDTDMVMHVTQDNLEVNESESNVPQLDVPGIEGAAVNSPEVSGPEATSPGSNGPNQRPSSPPPPPYSDISSLEDGENNSDSDEGLGEEVQQETTAEKESRDWPNSAQDTPLSGAPLTREIETRNNTEINSYGGESSEDAQRANMSVDDQVNNFFSGLESPETYKAKRATGDDGPDLDTRDGGGNATAGQDEEQEEDDEDSSVEDSSAEEEEEGEDNQAAGINQAAGTNQVAGTNQAAAEDLVGVFGRVREYLETWII